MSRRTGLFLLLAAAGLFLYLEPALRAPVVLWSDSAVDLDWARRGVGIVGAVPPPAAGEQPQRHPAKPAYLLFLRLVLMTAPGGAEPRAIVVVQSVLLWLSIVGTSLYLTRRRGPIGLAFLIVLLLTFRLREAASAVMPEALTAALFLPIAAILLEPPKSRVRLLLFGFGIALLFWIRPNVGGIALLLSFVAVALIRDGKGAAPVATGFAVLFLPIWFLTRPTQPAFFLRGVSHSIYEASLDDYWVPQGHLTAGADVERRELAEAQKNWKALLRSRGPDARRQVVWRSLHGLLGTEFSRAPAWSRIVTTFAILAAISLLVGGLLLGNRGAVLGLVLLLLLVVQNLVLGSNPRFVLPFLPVLFLFGINSAAWTSTVVAVLAFIGMTVFLALHPAALSWEWGRIEKAGVTIRQRITSGSLPRRAPATLHVRIASPLGPSAADLEIRAGGEVLYSSAANRNREKPAVAIALPQPLLDLNSREPIELELRFSGSYGETQYLLFPVIPPPWRRSASRDHSRYLSPSTGIRRGALDWWAHPGPD